MSAPVRPAVGARPDAGPAGAPRPGARPWWAWAVPFAAWLAVLLARNSFLFTTPVHEDADQGADSILIEQARHFSLLIGNYSRVGFNHPGPAFMYVQSWGESLLWAVAHVVPAPWNGQMIAVYALNALFAAFVVATCYSWTSSPLGAVLAIAALALLGALHPPVFSSDWNPYVYVPAYFAFLIAIASVAAGRVSDLWIAALSGWFLIHGHVCFLLFVPALTGCAAAALIFWPSGGGSRWRRLPAALRSFLRSQRRAWLPAVAISALFLVPVIAELALHWPGNFGKYLAYSSSSKAGGHSLRQDVQFVLWYWWPHAHAWAVALAVGAAAVALTWRMPPAPARRFAISLLAFSAITTACLVVYAGTGADALDARYIGYFYWTVPVAALMVAALAASSWASPARARAGAVVLGVAGLAAATAFTMFAVAPFTRITISALQAGGHANGIDSDPGLAAAVTRMAAGSGGHPIIVRIGNGSWMDLTGLLVQAERAGVPMCVPQPQAAFLVTTQFICGPGQLASGDWYWLVSRDGAVPRDTRLVLRLRWAFVVTGPGAPLNGAR